MRRLRAFLVRLTHSFEGQRQDRESRAEIADHIDRHVEDGIRDGLTPAEARRRAVVALGGIAQTTERIREQRGVAFLDSLVQDVRFALRLFRRSPGFAAIAILILALGLGLTTAVFTFGNWLVFGPIPGVVRSDDVVLFHTGYPSTRAGMIVSRISYPNYLDIAPRLTTITLAAMQRSTLAVSRDGQPALTESAQFVTASFFDLLGVAPQTGRMFSASEDNPSAPALVAVISDGLWARLFGRDPSAIGATLRIARQQVTIVGVAAADFRGPLHTSQDGLWLPGATYPLVNGLPLYDNRAEGGYYEFLARLRPGRSWPQAAAELNSFVPWLIQQYPTENKRLTAKGWSFTNVGPIGDYLRGRFQPMLTVLIGVAALVLLLTCSNVAGLLLIRGVGRADETGIRLALGAGPSRVLRQHVTEGVVLWLAGAAFGGLIVFVFTRVVTRTEIFALGFRDVRIPFDSRVAAFAAVTSLVVGIAFSSFPAWKALRSHTLVHAGQSTSTPRRSRLIAGSMFATVQFGISLTLLVGALLVSRTVRHVGAIDTGVNPTNLTVAVLEPSDARLDNAARWLYYQRMGEHIKTLPGVTSAALAETAPLVEAGNNLHHALKPTPDGHTTDARLVQVLSPDYFQTLGTPLRAGRPFASHEFAPPSGSGSPVIILTESLARALFGSVDVVGRIVYGRLQDAPHEVIGVVKDARMRSLTGEQDLVAYTPGSFFSGPAAGTPTSAVALVRTDGAQDLTGPIRQAGRAVDPAVPIDVIIPMEQALSIARIEWDALSWVFTIFSAVACTLSALGAYGVLAFSVAARRRELGIRMALGATPGHVRGLVARKTLPMLLGGLVLGLAGATGLAGLLRSRLVGVEPFDPTLWTLASAGLIVIGMAAAILPSSRAASTNVADTLRTM